MRRFLAACLVACSSHGAPQPVVATKHDVPPPAVVSNAWIEDDYARALADAKKANAPLFVDTSAVWCHTCKAMRAFVLDDASLPKSFVRLSIDVEKDQNASAVAAFPSHVLPTGGTARFSAPLSCNDFLKVSSLIRYGAADLAADAADVATFARREGLTAHARAAEIRGRGVQGPRG